MSILNWMEEHRQSKLPDPYATVREDGGLWTQCDKCDAVLYIRHLKADRRVCSSCGYHLQMNSKERITNLIDLGQWCPFDEILSPCNPLEFSDYRTYSDRLQDNQEKTEMQDAILTGVGVIDSIPVALGVMDFKFMGGSMGSVVGEKITRLIEYATQKGLILILFCASGGARMQEGILSLMQMAKISAALQIYKSYANSLYISILTSPTTGGVTASFAMLGDLIIAEPNALIGFAGRRIIEQLFPFQQEFPENFQTAEFLFEHGLINLIIERHFLKGALSELMSLHTEAPLKKRGKLPPTRHKLFNFLTEEFVRRKLNFETEKDENQSFLLNKIEDQSFILNKFLYESSLEKAEEFITKSSNLSTPDKELINLYYEILTSLNCVFNQNHENLIET